MISSWYSETIWGCVGVIFAIASRAMKRTVQSAFHRTVRMGRLTILITAFISKISSKLLHADSGQCLALCSIWIQHTTNDTRADAFVQQRDC